MEKDKKKLEKEISKISIDFEKLMVDKLLYEKNIFSTSIQTLFDLKKKYRLLGLQSLNQYLETKKKLQEKISNYETLSSQIKVKQIDEILKQISKTI